jgi:hypothetical protein
LPGRPWLWNCKASWSVKVGRLLWFLDVEDISTPERAPAVAVGG